MYYKYFERLASTQMYLIDHIEGQNQLNDPILIQACVQERGQGRRGTDWQHLAGSLAISFTYLPNHELTLTPLEVGVLVCGYFKETYSLEFGLKWPNDLFYQNKKVGGFIMNSVGSAIIVGLGINITDDMTKREKNNDFEFQTVFLSKINIKDLAKTLYQYLLDNRLSPEETILKWQDKCIHLGSEVSFDKQGKSYTGIFKGINNYGHGIVEISKCETFFLSSETLRINNLKEIK